MDTPTKHIPLSEHTRCTTAVVINFQQIYIQVLGSINHRIIASSHSNHLGLRSLSGVILRRYVSPPQSTAGASYPFCGTPRSSNGGAVLKGLGPALRNQTKTTCRQDIFRPARSVRFWSRRVWDCCCARKHVLSRTLDSMTKLKSGKLLVTPLLMTFRKSLTLLSS